MDKNLTVIEIGAGEFVPTVRRFSENMLKRYVRENQKTHLIRINPDDQFIANRFHKMIVVDQESTQESIENDLKEKKANLSLIKVNSGAKEALAAIT